MKYSRHLLPRFAIRPDVRHDQCVLDGIRRDQEIRVRFSGLSQQVDAERVDRGRRWNME